MQEKCGLRECFFNVSEYNFCLEEPMVCFGLQVWVRDLGFSSLVLASVEKVCDNTGEDPTCSR